MVNEKVSNPNARSVERILPWLVAMAFFMQTLDGTILNTAIPSIASSLKESPLRMQAMIISYMVTVALLIPASGWMADRFGTRRVFFAAIVIFTLGSLLCALSPSLKFMVMARVVQGVGGSMMAPVGRLAILRAYPRAQLVQVLSLIAMPGLVGPLIGPTLGGFLVQYASWHVIFLINIPVGIVGCLMALRYMPDYYGLKKSVFDWMGFFTFGLSMILVSVAVSGMSELHLGALVSGLLLLGGVLCLAFYIWHAGRHKDPLFELAIFRNKSFSVSIAGNIFARLGSGAMPFLMPLLLQVGLGYAPAKAGLCMLPMTAAAFAAKSFATQLLQRLGYRRLLTANTLLLGILITAFGTVSQHTPLWLLLIQVTIFGAVNSIQFTAMNTLALVDLPDSDASSGNSILSVVMQLSMSFGVGLAAILLGAFTAPVAAGQAGSSLHGFQYTFFGVGIAAITATAIFLLTPKDAGHRSSMPVAAPH